MSDKIAKWFAAEWCANGECESPAVEMRGDLAACELCAEAYDRGYADGCEDGDNAETEVREP